MPIKTNIATMIAITRYRFRPASPRNPMNVGVISVTARKLVKRFTAMNMVKISTVSRAELSSARKNPARSSRPVKISSTEHGKHPTPAASLGVNTPA